MTDEHDPLRERLNLLVPISNLDAGQIDQVARTSTVVEVKKKDYIFRQGDRDNWSFYVIEGEVELYADDQLIKRVVGGEGPSFHALAQLQPRQMSARARSRASVLRVDRGVLDKLLSVEPGERKSAAIEVQEIDTSDSTDWLTEMLQSELFVHVPPSNIQKLLETLESVEFKAGDVVIEQGAPGDYYYAIQSGRCEVIRTINNNKSIRLAELRPGARFGEEALVSNAKRNATVKMLTDGELARLTKEDFVELIKTPVLRRVTLDEARAAVADGGRWLDVRFPEEHAANGLEGSLNIPLSNLRVAHQELDNATRYVVYCDTGGRSSAGAFLLTQEGFEVCYVEGGAIDEVSVAKPKAARSAPARAASVKSKTTDSRPPQAPATPPVADEQNELVDADSRAQSLTADLEKAKLQIERAERLMAEANAAKAEVDRLVAEKLRAEREKIDAEAAALAARAAEADRLVAEKLETEREKIDEQAAAAAARQAEADRLASEKLETERQKIERESAAVAARLQEAQRLKDEIERKQAAAAEEAEKRHRAQEERNNALRAEAERRLREDEERIEELYRLQAEKLEELERSREQAQSELEAAKALEHRLQEEEQQRQKALQEEENRMRAALQAELDRERKKIELEFANMTEQTERARREQLAARAAKEAAAEEARRIIEEFKQSHEKMHADQHAKLQAERERLQTDAARLKEELATAARARAEAEQLKRDAEAQLVATRERQRANEDTEVNLRAEIEAIEARARAATERLKNAVAVETKAEDNIRESEKRLERTYGTQQEMNLLLQRELDEWVEEQERIQGSTARREELEKQLRQTERIKTRAMLARKESARHDANLLDEIAAQLQGAD